MLTHFPGPWKHSCALAITLHYGSHAEPAELRGYTHFTEHLMFSGTQKYPREKLREAYEKVANIIEATTSRQYVRLWAQFHKDDVRMMCDIFSQMLFHWECKTAELPRQREMLLEEWKEFQKMEERRILENIHRLLQIDAPNPMGTRAFLESIDPTDVRKAKKHWESTVLQAPRSVFAVGAFSPEELQSIRKIFCSPFPTQAPTTWEATSSTFAASKDTAGFFFQSNADHPLVILLDRIFYWRWQNSKNMYFYRMYTLRPITGFFYYDPQSLDPKKAKRFFTQEITPEEFSYAKTHLMRYWESAQDLVDMEDALFWLDGFNERHYGPWSIRSPQDAYVYTQSVTVEDLRRIHLQLCGAL